MGQPTFGFHRIPHSEFNDHLDYRLSVPEIEAKIDSIFDGDRAAKLYFVGGLERSPIDSVNRESGDFFTALAKVTLVDCVYFGSKEGYQITFEGQEAAPADSPDTDPVFINREGAFLPTNQILRMGYFTDDVLYEELGRGSLEAGVNEVEAFLAKQARAS